MLYKSNNEHIQIYVVQRRDEKCYLIVFGGFINKLKYKKYILFIHMKYKYGRCKYI